MSWRSLPQLDEASVSPKLCQPRRIRIAATLAEVGAGSVIVILYQADVPIAYLWPFAGMWGVITMLHAIGFVAACLRADGWEARERE